MHSEKTQQLESQLKTSGFTLLEPFHENEKGETTARVINEKGEELLITILPVSEGQEPEYQFQLLGSADNEKVQNENAGKTFTLHEDELEKGLPLIQKNPNQALKLKSSGWNFAAPLAGIAGAGAGMVAGMMGKAAAGISPEVLPMPPSETTKKLAKRVMVGDLADQQAQEQAQDAAEEMAIKTAGLLALQQMRKLPTLPEMLKKKPQKEAYSPQMPEKIRIKVPTGKITETEKSVALDKLRGEIPVTEREKPQKSQEGSQVEGRPQQPEQPLADLQQPQEEETPLIPLAQKAKSPKSRLVKYIAGGAVATGIGITGSGLFPIFFG